MWPAGQFALPSTEPRERVRRENDPPSCATPDDITVLTRMLQTGLGEDMSSGAMAPFELGGEGLEAQRSWTH